MTAAPESVQSISWSERLWQDLQPAPGRLAATLRIVLATVVALVLMMALQLPFASLGLYYIFLVVRESPAVSVRAGVMAILTLVLAVAAELAVIVITDNDPMGRLLSVGIVAFVAGTLMAASTMPAFAAIWGFVYCTLIALWERPVPADALVKASLYLIATVSLAFICSVAVEYLFAFRENADRLADQLRMRYELLAGVFTLFAQGAPRAQLEDAILRLNRLAATGPAAMVELYLAVAQRDAFTADVPSGSRSRITRLAQLMDVAAAFASSHPAGVGPELRARCAEIARRCKEKGAPGAEAGSVDAAHLTLLDRVEAALDALSLPGEASAGEDDLAALPAKKAPFLIPGAIKNKAVMAYALKITLCVMVSYVFYFAVGWPGISTSVTTVFITALGTTGAIKQKLFNRLIGSAIGGALALGATAFLFPLMDSITSLVVLIAFVAFISAWWAGGKQFGYAGLQIAFSFYLVAFEGFSAPTELAPARDRLVGILIALVVMWIVFDQLWPVRTVTAMRGALAGILRGEARFLRLFESEAPHRVRLQQVDGLRDQISKAIAGLRGMNDAILYEFGAHREKDMRTSETLLAASLTAVPFFWNQLAVLRNEAERDFLTEPGLVEMRRKVAARFDVIADAVARGTAVTPVDAAELVDASILANPRFGEYARHTVAAHEAVQARVATPAQG